ncbi:MAG: T9SS type A sorting domain-containing protein [Muribaculaceae bacterium]|nr:T9SS type A sorting domain-containing protein [Muribaculaceae bacterium]
MKRLFLSIAVLATFLTGFAGKKVPYTSDFYPNQIIDDGWQTKNLVSRNGISWVKGELSELNGFNASGLAKKPYDNSQKNTADTWLISPAINVTAGKEYTVSIMARTKSTYGEPEAFRVNIASSSDVSELKQGTVIIEKSSYINKGDFEKIEATYIPTETGEIYFGVQCFSEPDMDTLYLTRFSIEGDGSEEGDDPIDDEVVKELPFEFDFTDADAFNNEWKSVNGPDAVNTTDKWTRVPFKNNDYAKWDFTNGKKEDNWLISPAINFEHAGTYNLDLNIWANGKLKVCYGSDPEDLSSFNLITTIENNVMPDDDQYDRFIINITEPGKYYLGFHACSESGDFMGHRIYNVKVKESVVTPTIANHFKAEVDKTDALAVTLSWNYPTKTNTDEDLTSIAKAELLRGEDVIATFENPAVGSTGTYTDSAIPAAGVYTYKIIVYGESGGYDTDKEIPTLTTNYVGKPTMEFPCDLSNFKEEETALFTIIDANEDGITWTANKTWNTYDFVSENKDLTTEMDDYLISPYVHLDKGYYRLTLGIGAKNNAFEVGYLTDRHNPAESFVKIAEKSDSKYSSTDDEVFILNIPADGDYCIGIHHTGAVIDSSDQYYYKVTFDAIAIEEQPLIPGVATELSAEAADDNSLKATVTWKNPALDIAGEPLTAISKAIIYRDGEEAGTVTADLVPGELSSYTDEAVPVVGYHTYKVEIYNENGKAEASAPEVKVYVGPGITKNYTTTTFEDWETLSENDSYSWQKGEYDDYFNYYKSWGDPYYAYASSPYFELKKGYKYEVAIETVGGGSLTANLLNGSDRDVVNHNKVGEFTPHATDDIVHTFTFAAVDPATPATLAEEETAAINVPAGKNVFSFHANSLGKMEVKSFSVTEKGIQSGVQTIYATAGSIKYSDGKVYVNLPSEIAVYSLDGKLLVKAFAVSELDLSSLEKGMTVIVKATTNGNSNTLKVIL